jgi:hypothetical protein
MAAQVCTTVSTVLGEGGPLSAIPKLIHQTWRSPHVPERWRAAVRSWKAHHPAWAYRLRTDADARALVAERRPSLLSKFDAYPYAIPGSRLVLACGPMARGRAWHSLSGAVWSAGSASCAPSRTGQRCGAPRGWGVPFRRCACAAAS